MLVTVDLPVSGKRERDPRNGFHTPYSPNWRNSKDVIFKPAWALDMLRNGLPGMANLEGYPFSMPVGTDIVTAVGREMDAGLDWEYIKRLRNEWPRKLLLKGVEALKQQKLDDALAFFQKAVEQGPEIPTGFYYLGVTWERKGETERALGAFQKALELKPDYAQAQTSLGLLYWRQDDRVRRGARAKMRPSARHQAKVKAGKFDRIGREPAH